MDYPEKSIGSTTAPLFTQGLSDEEIRASAKPLNHDLNQRGFSSAVERAVHIGDVVGSTPTTPTILSPLDTAYFWGRANVRHKWVCWPWDGRRSSAEGYGRFKGQQAHRIAYELVNGPVPPGMVVRHKCDNPPCCNPLHLEIGTHLDNSRDAVERDRVAYGTRNAKTKLTDDQVRYARQNPDNLTGKALAEMFGVCEATISYVRSNMRRQRVE